MGHDGVTARRSGALVVPISDVAPSEIVEPVVADTDGVTLGVAQVPRVGEVHKDYLKSRAGALAPASAEIVDMALRVALAL
ncbi:hypothetical protein I4J89_35850 [Actinoplanes sp. NEAU-A11]|uniref:Uncharacterized protein n=1 Tax=Actinoplanes aureus TaxID=2792083 RepID=A0A931G1B4_9ACTN|nr:hypothetical protein [Actinoplanes aureus]MBG0566835.1 hypothetical protein [Actinoplanes aureus]